MSTILSEGLLEIIFLAQNYYGISTSPSSSGTTSMLPETLRLDSVRLSTLHCEVTDLTVVYLLLSLFRQLSSPVRVGEVELGSMKKEIVCLMRSEGDEGGLSGIEKLGCPVWRGRMKGVLLHIAARSAPRSTPPSDSTISLVNSFFETNLKTDSKLFRLFQGRLRTTIQLAIERSLLTHSPSTAPTKNGLPPHSSTKAISDLTVKFQSSLTKNGLAILESEIMVVVERTAKVISFHEQVYGRWYRTRLAADPEE